VRDQNMIRYDQLPTLMIVHGLGFAAIFLLLASMTTAARLLGPAHGIYHGVIGRRHRRAAALTSGGPGSASG
jgi:hypothetical protein